MDSKCDFCGVDATAVIINPFGDEIPVCDDDNVDMDFMDEIE